MLRPGSNSAAHHSHTDSDIEDSTEKERPDAPRVAQWVDEEELGEEASEKDGSDFTSLKHDLSKLPLGALIKAHKAISPDPESDEYDSSSESDQELQEDSRHKEPGPSGASPRKEKRPIEHRTNKHAPMEVTSKKPVPRRRQIVDVRTVRPRDPRFSDLSGKLSIDSFRSHYDFLPELHTGELTTLKQTLSRARKLLISSPYHLREEREEEVNKLELAVKRAESTVNRERREEAERKALGKLQHEEKEKRKAGKKGWWIKDADKKAIRVRARMDAIAATGGSRAVKKAIEKKQRKIGQKEKKSRPFAPPQREGGSQKRSMDEGGASGRQGKRRRIE